MDVAEGVQMDSAEAEIEDPILDLVPLIRRVVGARVRDPHLAEDLVQETLARVMAARSRVEGDTLAPYAVVTARNLIASVAQRDERARRNAHLLVEHDESGTRTRRRYAGTRLDGRAALSRLSQAGAGDPPRPRGGRGRHRVARRAAPFHSGAIAAQLNRTRARLRMEYLLAQSGSEPPTDRCRPVLLALSAGDRRRQREAGHLRASALVRLLCPVEHTAARAPGNAGRRQRDQGADRRRPGRRHGPAEGA